MPSGIGFLPASGFPSSPFKFDVNKPAQNRMTSEIGMIKLTFVIINIITT